MYGILLFIHIGVSILLILAVLMQSGKGGGLSGAFGGGGGGNQTAFGGRGAVDFLGKATWILGSAFMVLSLLLAAMASGDGGPSSLIQKSAVPPPAFPPATAPGTPLDSGTTPDPVSSSNPPLDGVPADDPASGGETPADPSSPGGN